MERRALRLHSYVEASREAEALLAVLYDRAGAWGLGEVAHHLAAALEMSLDGFPSRMPWPVRLVARWFVLGRLLRHRVLRRRVPAPSYLLPPRASDDRKGVERLQKALARVDAHTGSLQPSPVFGTLSASEWREVHLWHCEHHLSFLVPRASP